MGLGWAAGNPGSSASPCGQAANANASAGVKRSGSHSGADALSMASGRSGTSRTRVPPLCSWQKAASTRETSRRRRSGVAAEAPIRTTARNRNWSHLPRIRERTSALAGCGP